MSAGWRQSALCRFARAARGREPHRFEVAKTACETFAFLCREIGQRWLAAPVQQLLYRAAANGHNGRGAARRVPTNISTANELDSNSQELEINIFTVGDLDDISHQLELFFERVVPRTPLGTLDAKRCEREAVRDAVAQANANVAKRYQEAFDATTAMNGKALPVAGKFRETCATLTTEFSPVQPPKLRDS